MCTAITYKAENSYFGRTLDVYFSYGQEIVVTPRNFSFTFRDKGKIRNRYAIIGAAVVKENYPLYFEAANECGLAMAGLNFPKNAVYYDKAETKDNIPPFEFIPWILSQCKNLDDAKKLIKNINLWNENFSENMPLSPLHWIIADKEKAITAESTKDGIRIFDNPFGVMTNDPTFDYHLINLGEYANLTNKVPENLFGDVKLNLHSLGIGAKGLPGENSSTARFVRAAFTKTNAETVKDENESVRQFFHILGSVNQVKGCNKTTENKSMYTDYTSCINLDKGIYYYTTYENSCISAIDMHKCNLDGDKLVKFPFRRKLIIENQN
ncbi:MAG: choloylglycine hydrolase family protein [Ruminococcaceae bacterium]|nr:choloylglycine hydrolase family protein [Oscillospiraceae bacterium]